MPESKDQEQTIKTAAGTPFKTIKSASFTMAQKSLDVREWQIIPVPGGFAIERKTDLPPSASSPKPARERIDSSGEAKEVPVEHMSSRFFVVNFGAQRDKNEPVDVVLSLNGAPLVMKRQVEVIIPGSYLEIAQHAHILHFEQLPNKPRKVDAHIDVYPCTILREASEAEYKAFRKSNAEKRQD